MNFKIKDILEQSALTMFVMLLKPKAIVLLLIYSLSVPIVQAIRFNLSIDSSVLLNIVVSFLVALLFYVGTYGLGKLIQKISIKITNTDIVSLLFVPQMLFVGLFFVVMLETLLVPNWKYYSAAFNPSLVLLAVYYSLGSLNFSGKFVPEFFSRAINSKEMLKSITTYVFIIVSIVGIYISDSNSRKAELYKKSQAILNEDLTVNNLLGNEFSYSYLTTGYVEKTSAKLNYNIFNSDKIFSVTVKGKQIDGYWIISDLTISDPSHSYKVMPKEE